MSDDLTGQAVRDAVRLVQTRQVTPSQLVQAHLERIAARDPLVGAFQTVAADQALAAAHALEREDLTQLPLAGLPVAIKDNIDVSGIETRNGLAARRGALPAPSGTVPARSGALPAPRGAPAGRDHVIVRRLREAGAIVLGKTRVPDLSLWGTSDGPGGVARNPWDLTRTAGGSSGGSAAAVAAGMVPVAHGTDGLGSIRIPAAACGVLGLKPGVGLLPADLGASNWFGMAENGVLATTVEDVALVLSALAADPSLAQPLDPPAGIRIAVSTASPLIGGTVDAGYARAALETADLLAVAGHRVVREDPPYATGPALALMSRWCAAAAQDAEILDDHLLTPRTRRHVQVGRICRRLGLIRQADAAAWRAQCRPFFARHEVLLTPALAQLPVAADGWAARSWAANVWGNIQYAPFAAAWNLAQFPALTVPAGLHASGMPVAVQLVAGVGGERLLLSIARQIEAVRPWPRHAPVPPASRHAPAARP